MSGEARVVVAAWGALVAGVLAAPSLVPLLAGVAPVEIVRWMSDPQLAVEEEL